jgi:uncharacterized protein
MLPYNSLNAHLRGVFGGRVRKIALDAGFTCPNRDGTVGMGGCTYCDASGSGPGSATVLSVREQICAGVERAKGSTFAGFLAYFQAFSNTHASPSHLRELYAEALDHPAILGLDIATRPDCLDDDVLDVIEVFHRQTYLWLEIGLQSACDATLRRINRGHTANDFIDAVKRARSRGIRVCAHVIFGLPGESREETLKTIELVADLRVEGIKFHNLYLVPGTVMHQQITDSGERLMSREAYADLVADALEMLPHDTIIHRLTGDPPRGIPAIPEWAADKHGTIGQITATMTRRGTIQGSHHLS